MLQHDPPLAPRRRYRGQPAVDDERAQHRRAGRVRVERLVGRSYGALNLGDLGEDLRSRGQNADLVEDEARLLQTPERGHHVTQDDTGPFDDLGRGRCAEENCGEYPHPGGFGEESDQGHGRHSRQRNSYLGPESYKFPHVTRYADDMALAHVLADTADAIAMSRFRAQDLRVSSKPDLTPVSDADEAVEKALRATLARTRPRDGVLGEEYGVSVAAAGPSTRQWVIDPIDATKNFVRGVPIWGTLIALMDGSEPVVGMVSAPALSRRWWAAKGLGAYAGRHTAAATAIKVSGINRLADASFCYSSLNGWEQAGRLDAILDLTRRAWRSRAYGDFYGYMLVAEGAVDVMVEPELSLWDLAALVPIVTEAGGTFTDLGGRPGPSGGSAVATNGKLHPEILERLSA